MSVLSTLAGLLMAVASGTLTITTGAVGTTFTCSGLPFQPTAILFNWSGRTGGVGVAEADHRWGTGIAVSTSSRRAYSSQADYPPTTMATDCIWRNDACIATQTITGAIEGLADLDAILSDGFRLIVDDAFALALEVQWIAWDATSVQIVDHVTPAATGNQDIATSFALNTGLDDKAVIMIGGVFAAVNTAAAYSTHCIGVAACDTPVSAVLAGASSDAVGTSVTCAYCRTGDIIAEASDDTIVYRASLSAWLATGFRLNYTTAAANRRFSALVMQGGNRWTVGDAVTSTGTTNQAEATAYTPTGLIVGSACRAQSTAGATSVHDERSLGFATSPSSRSNMSLVDADAALTAELAPGYHTDRIYTNYDQTNANKATVHGIMDLVSFDATPGFTFVMDDADNAANYFWYLVTSAAASSGTTIVPGFGALDLTGFSPSLGLPRTITPGLGALALAGCAPTFPREVKAGSGALTLTGFGPTFGLPRTIVPGFGALALTGFGPAIGLPKTIVPGAGALSLTGCAPQFPRTIIPGFGVLDLNGFGPSFTFASGGYTALPGSGALTLAGFGPTIGLPRTLRPGLGALDLSGYAPAVGLPITVQPSVGLLTLTGFGPGISVTPLGLFITPGTGQLALTGYAPSIGSFTFRFQGGPVMTATITAGGVLVASLSGGPILTGSMTGGPA